MKIIGNIIYVKVDKELYRKGIYDEKSNLLKMVTKIIDAQIQSSEVDYISIINISNERRFMRKLKNISRLVCKEGTVMYLFQWC